MRKENVNVSAEAGYDQCLEKARQCWWYENWMFQSSVSVICGVLSPIIGYVLLLTALTFLGQKGFPPDSDAREPVGAPSLYGGLLGSSENAAKVDDLVGQWLVRGAWSEILYSVALFSLAFTTLLHMNAGISFGFAVDMLEVVVMFACKTVVAWSALQVHRNLSPLSRRVAAHWGLVLAVSKGLLAVCTLVLASGYATAVMSGGMGSLCMWGFRFCWTLVISAALECSSALALCRVQQRAVSYLGDPLVFSSVIGCSWLLLVCGTLGAGCGLGTVAAIFIFDDPHDHFSPFCRTSVEGGLWIGDDTL